MKKVRIAAIGTSKYSHGSAIFASLCKQTDLFEVVGYAFPENEDEKFPEFKEQYAPYRRMTVEEILSDPTIEAVAVETEEVYLLKYAKMVAKAGKHLHMEKPGSPNLEDFRELVSILKEKNLAFTLGYMYRFNPSVQEVLARIKSGEIGKVFAVEAHMGCKHDPVWRQWLENFPGGMMFFLGCHLVDLVYQIMGEPEAVIPMNAATGIDGVNTTDFGMAAFKYKNGTSVIKTCDSEYGAILRRHLLVTGEKGSFEIEPLEYGAADGMHAILGECLDPGWQVEWKKTKSEPFDRYDNMMKNFAEIVRGKENPYSYDYELRLFELVMQACGK